MELKKDFDLTNLNTFGVQANARFFVELTSEKDLVELLQLDLFQKSAKLFLGGGSNVLFTTDFDGFVVLNKLTGIEILEENPERVRLKVMAGENWHSLVLFTVKHGWWGIENLAYIPGSVGGAPVQNIGAYGSELSQTIESVEAYNTETNQKVIFSKTDCNFGYRDSFFKQSPKGRYLITSIVLVLSKAPKINTSYKILADYLAQNQIEVKSPQDIANVVVAIRNTKLPDPKVLGNAGSFFKNVYVNEAKKNSLLAEYSTMPFFVEEGKIKIPAGWLVEQCGWKGKKVGNVGVHEKQALVLVNYGGGTGLEVKSLAEGIIKSVQEKFGIRLTPEVNII